MKILVTGAAGLWFTLFCDALINENLQVVGIDDLSGGFGRKRQRWTL